MIWLQNPLNHGKYIEEIMHLLAGKIYNKVEGNTFYFPVQNK